VIFISLFTILGFLLLSLLYVILKSGFKSYEPVNIRRETYEDMGGVSEYHVDFINIITRGEIYTEDIVVQDSAGYKNQVRLYISKANLQNGAEIKAVVGILYGEEYQRLSNVWLYNLFVTRGIDIKDVDVQKLERSLRDIFEKGAEFEYAYYSNEDLEVQMEYLDVLSVVSEGWEISSIKEDLIKNGYTEKVLMPYVILDKISDT
jgi:hypothetical protein